MLKSTLGIVYTDGSRARGDLVIKVELLPRHARLLLALVEGYHRTLAARSSAPASIFGAPTGAPMSASEVTDLYGKVPPAGNSISEASLRSYVSDIRARVREAVDLARRKELSSKLPVPEVIVFDGGYRIGDCGIHVYGPPPI